MGLASNKVDGTVLIAKYRLYIGHFCLRPIKKPNLVTFAEAANHRQLHPSLEEFVLAAET